MLYSRGPYPTADSNNGAEPVEDSDKNAGAASPKAGSAKANDSLTEIYHIFPITARIRLVICPLNF